jgi:hypothetical protein
MDGNDAHALRCLCDVLAVVNVFEEYICYYGHENSSSYQLTTTLFILLLTVCVLISSTVL